MDCAGTVIDSLSAQRDALVHPPLTIQEAIKAARDGSKMAPVDTANWSSESLPTSVRRRHCEPGRGRAGSPARAGSFAMRFFDASGPTPAALEHQVAVVDDDEVGSGSRPWTARHPSA